MNSFNSEPFSSFTQRTCHYRHKNSNKKKLFLLSESIIWFFFGHDLMLRSDTLKFYTDKWWTCIINGCFSTRLLMFAFLHRSFVVIASLTKTVISHFSDLITTFKSKLTQIGELAFSFEGVHWWEEMNCNFWQFRVMKLKKEVRLIKR